MRQRVMTLSTEMHLSNSEISRRTSVPRTTVRDILSQKSARTNTKPRGRPPQKISDRDLRRLIRAICASEDGRQASYVQLAKDLGINASKSTLQKRLKEAGFRRCKACPKPFINEINRRKRLKFCREHLKWTDEQWKCVIWTDESSFETGKKGKIWVTRRHNERYCPDCIEKTRHSGRSSVMVWGAISGHGCSDLVWIRPTQKIQGGHKTITTIDYIEQVLDPYIEPLYRGIQSLGIEPILMEDNAAIHKSKEAELWKRQAGLKTIEWPPCSPDLNPDEYMWKYMKQHINGYKQVITKQEEIWEAADFEWDENLRSQRYLKYIESMPARIRAVIRNRGFGTAY